jgi:Rieske Fe-S protein
MKDGTLRDNKLTRRQALASVGTLGAGAALGGCAMIRGGASHPNYSAAPSHIQGDALRLPVSQMTFPSSGVLLVIPGGDWPKLLVRRDPDGTYAVASANCTHFSCVLGWDGSQKQWACPCHGSRFGEDGAVLTGPAKRALLIPKHRMEGEVLVVELKQA